jgi:hypothetical protein
VLLGIVVVTAPVWMPALALAVAVVVSARAIKVAVLYALVWTFWLGASPRRVLFIYSNSPNWKVYVESRILPRLPEHTVVLNWSDRGQWSRVRVPVMLFKCFAGRREFNPIGLVFERWRTVGDYRFWRPFRDAKHGRGAALARVEAEFLSHVAGQPTRRAQPDAETRTPDVS